MAPFQGPGREALLKILGGWFGVRKLPITLGQYSPQAVVERQGGQWCIVALRMNEQEAAAAGKAAIEAGETWIPEMEWRFLEKAETIVSAESRKAFIEEIRKIDWIWGP